MKLLKRNYFFTYDYTYSYSVHNILFEINSGQISIYFFINKVYGVSLSTLDTILWKFGYKNRFVKLMPDKISHILFFSFMEQFIAKSGRLKKLELLYLAKYQYYLNFKGHRHYRGLPVNGQRTVSNAKSSRSVLFHKKILDILSLIETNTATNV